MKYKAFLYHHDTGMPFLIDYDFVNSDATTTPIE
jgi:hypothetical protein